MTEADATATYISASTNRFPNAATERNSLIALASWTYVALWNTEVWRRKTIFTAFVLADEYFLGVGRIEMIKVFTPLYLDIQGR